MPATTEQQQLKHDLRHMFEGGDGIATFAMLSGPAALAIIDDAIRGDARSKAIMAAAEGLLERLETVEAGAALACALCDARVLWRDELPSAVAVLVPSEITGAAIALGICANCTAGRTKTQLTDALVAKLRAELMPGLRLLPTTATMPEAGHA
jgi:hypothetical protein